jgi:hypothetical protein
MPYPVMAFSMRAKPRSHSCNAKRTKSAKTDNAQRTNKFVKQSRSNKDSRSSRETKLNTGTLDPKLSAHDKMSARTTAPATSPGLPIPLHLRGRPPHLLMSPHRLVPLVPRLSIREGDYSGCDARMRTFTAMGSHEHLPALVSSSSFQGLSEAQALKAKRYKAFWVLKYHFTYHAFRPFLYH